MKERGFAGMSTQEIADALDFSKANFFYHLNTKEDLLFEIFVETLNFGASNFEAILKRPDPPVQKLNAVIDFYVHLMMERTAVMLVWFKEKGHLSPEHEEEVSRLERRITTMLTDFYCNGIAKGAFRPIDPMLARIVIFGMCFGLTRWPQVRDQLSIATLSSQIQQIARQGLVQDAGTIAGEPTPT